MEQGDSMSTTANVEPRAPIVTDRTAPQNLQAQIPAQAFLDFDHLARRRGLSKSVLLRRVVEAIGRDPKKLDKIIGKASKP
jgi:hypothetical protein